MDDKVSTELEEGEIFEEATSQTTVEKTSQPFKIKPTNICQPPKTSQQKKKPKPRQPAKANKQKIPQKTQPNFRNQQSNKDSIDPTIDVCENEEILREARKNFVSIAQKAKKNRRKKYAEKERAKAANLKKLQCSFYLSGRCTRGSNCQYGHFDVDKIPEPCKLYSTTQCPYGSKCSYMHGDYPCIKFHVMGSCGDNQKCRFSHDELNEKTRKIIANLTKTNESETKLSCAKSQPAKKVNDERKTVDERLSKTSKKRKKQMNPQEVAKRFATIFDFKPVENPVPDYPKLKNIINSRCVNFKEGSGNTSGSSAKVKTRFGPPVTPKPPTEKQTVVVNNYYFYPPNYHSEYEKLKASLTETDNSLPPFEKFSILFTDSTPKTQKSSEVVINENVESAGWSENNPTLKKCGARNSSFVFHSEKSTFSQFGKFSNLTDKVVEPCGVTKFVNAAKNMFLVDKGEKIFNKKSTYLKNLKSLEIEDDWQIVRSPVKSDDKVKNDAIKDVKDSKLAFDSSQIPYEYEDDESLPCYARIPGILKRKYSFTS